MTEKISKTIKELENNNIKAYYAENCEEAVEIVKGLINKGDVISFGGSVTLKECGIMNLISNGDYTLLDRSKEGLSREAIEKIFRDSFSADVYFSGTNAITENGELYNVDGNGNRVNAIMFGPKSVIIVAGYNKIVENLDKAIERVKKIAAPKNCVRLSKNTYCAKCGECVSLKLENPQMTDGCDSDDRICRLYTVTGKQKAEKRIKVIIIGEELGY